MATKTREKPSPWTATDDGRHWEKTPIWDTEFAERWDALHAELTEPAEPPAPARKPRSKTPRR